MEIKWITRPPDRIKKIYPRSVWNFADSHIHLTFDDGPDEETENLLKWLNDEKIKAVFFLLPEKAERYSSLVREMISEKHEVGSHFLRHRPYWSTGKKIFKEELIKATEIISRVSGSMVTLCRAPYGRILPFQEKWIENLGLEHWFWSLNSGDYRKGLSSDLLYSKLKRNLIPGDIILLHDSVSMNRTLEALRRLSDSGINFVPKTD